MITNNMDSFEKRVIRNKRYRLVEKMKAIPRREYLMTIRYDNNSHNEMLDYCRTFESKGIKCMYGCPKEISSVVVKDSILIILEMNNSENIIEAIGMVRNTPQEPSKFGRKLFSIHNDGNLNRFVYVGTKRILRNEMTQEEEEVMQALDILCFYGQHHQKRCHGITMFPLDIIEKCKPLINLTEFCMNMFKKRLTKENNYKQVSL